MKANYHPERFGQNEVFQDALAAVAKGASDMSESEYRATSRAVGAPGTTVLGQITGEPLTPNQAQCLVESMLMKMALDLGYTGASARAVERYIMALSDAFTIVAAGVDWSQ